MSTFLLRWGMVLKIFFSSGTNRLSWRPLESSLAQELWCTMVDRCVLSESLPFSFPHGVYGWFCPLKNVNALLCPDYLSYPPPSLSFCVFGDPLSSFSSMTSSHPPPTLSSAIRPIWALMQLCDRSQYIRLEWLLFHWNITF